MEMAKHAGYGGGSIRRSQPYFFKKVTRWHHGEKSIFTCITGHKCFYYCTCFLRGLEREKSNDHQMHPLANSSVKAGMREDGMHKQFCFQKFCSNEIYGIAPIIQCQVIWATWRLSNRPLFYTTNEREIWINNNMRLPCKRCSMSME